MGQTQLATGSQTQPEKYRIELLVQFAQAQVVAQALAVAHFNAANLQDEIHFALGKIVHQLVFGNPVLVKPAGFLPRFENHHLMPVQCQAMGASQPRRSGADHRDAFAGGRGTLERMLAELCMIDRIAL